MAAATRVRATSAPAPSRSPKRPAPRSTAASTLARVKDPCGRVDWLAARLLERAIERSGNPVLEALYREFRGDLEGLLNQHLGPRNPRMKALQRLVRAGAKGTSARGAQARVLVTKAGGAGAAL